MLIRTRIEMNAYFVQHSKSTNLVWPTLMDRLDWPDKSLEKVKKRWQNANIEYKASKAKQERAGVPESKLQFSGFKRLLHEFEKRESVRLKATFDILREPMELAEQNAAEARPGPTELDDSNTNLTSEVLRETTTPNRSNPEIDPEYFGRTGERSNASGKKFFKRRRGDYQTTFQTQADAAKKSAEEIAKISHNFELYTKGYFSFLEFLKTRAESTRTARLHGDDETAFRVEKSPINTHPLYPQALHHSDHGYSTSRASAFSLPLTNKNRYYSEQSRRMA